MILQYNETTIPAAKNLQRQGFRCCPLVVVVVVVLSDTIISIFPSRQFSQYSLELRDDFPRTGSILGPLAPHGLDHLLKAWRTHRMHIHTSWASAQ